MADEGRFRKDQKATKEEAKFLGISVPTSGNAATEEDGVARKNGKNS